MATPTDQFVYFKNAYDFVGSAIKELASASQPSMGYGVPVSVDDIYKLLVDVQAKLAKAMARP